MKNLLIVCLILMFSACSTEYILVEGSDAEYYTDSSDSQSGVVIQQESVIGKMSANNVYPIEEGADYIVYQYRGVKVDEVSALATLYCQDMTFDGEPYLREVIRAQNGFMKATFDCLNLAI